MPHCTYSFRLATVVRTSCVGKINRGIAPWGGQDYERLEQALKIVSETDGGRSVKRNPRGGPGGIAPSGRQDYERPEQANLNNIVL